MSIAQLYNVEKNIHETVKKIQLKKHQNRKTTKTKTYIQIQVQDKCEKGWNY